MAPSKPTTTSPTTSLTNPLATLTTLHLTLHHLNHRNKNQHRLAKWYKSLTQFLRQSAKLSREIEEFDAARVLDPGYGRTDGKVRKESKFTIAAREKLIARIEYLALGRKGDMIGKWYLAFSTLVADNQYASLGLMLIGSLARFQTVVKQVAKQIGVDLEVREIPVEEEKSGLILLQERKGPETSNDDLGEVISREKPLMPEVQHEEGPEDGEEEEGVVETKKRKQVKREVLDDEDGEVEVERKSSAKEKKRKGVGEEIKVGKTSKAKKPKKKKKGDAFDDLFGSLI